MVQLSEADLEGEAKPQALWKPSCIYAIRLLTQCTGEGRSSVLPAWCEHALSIKAAVAAIGNMPEAQQPGASMTHVYILRLTGPNPSVKQLRFATEQGAS